PAVSAARADVEAFDAALGRLRAAPAARKTLAELGRLVRTVASGRAARSHPRLAERAARLGAALRASPGPLGPEAQHEVDLLRQQLEAIVAAARFEAALRIAGHRAVEPSAASMSP